MSRWAVQGSPPLPSLGGPPCSKSLREVTQYFATVAVQYYWHAGLATYHGHCLRRIHGGTSRQMSVELRRERKRRDSHQTLQALGSATTRGIITHEVLQLLNCQYFGHNFHAIGGDWQEQAAKTSVGDTTAIADGHACCGIPYRNIDDYSAR
ncbi:hypothetical protein K474DRAFT_1671866 [Panus rudis PR-1116 ss-1]|nr:hypothetical protein K474DRAFT_1671866 [Panus rudis PR-1116 ss-1]